MHRYVVTFHKMITDGAGHDQRVAQHRAVVRASSETAALIEAKALFCQAESIADWRLRADTCEAVPLAGAGAGV